MQGLGGRAARPAGGERLLAGSSGLLCSCAASDSLLTYLTPDFLE